MQAQEFGIRASHAPQFVKPYVKTNKKNAADSEAICEAMAQYAVCAAEEHRTTFGPRSLSDLSQQGAPQGKS
ncbi:MAG: hypothetical protein KKE41_02715 [Gammaproteobacteria bacterium]|nr:hypothetical protein [Gammaproteobacteria bacterium]